MSPVRSCSWENKPSRNGDDPVCDLYKRPVQDDGESRPVIFLQERRERVLIATIGLGETPISGRRINLGKLVAAATKVFQIPDSGGTKGCVEKVGIRLARGCQLQGSNGARWSIDLTR